MNNALAMLGPHSLLLAAAETTTPGTAAGVLGIVKAIGSATTNAYFDTTQAVKERLDAEGIVIPFPQRDVHMFQEK